MRILALSSAALMALGGVAYAESAHLSIARTNYNDSADATAISGAIALPLRGHLAFQVDANAIDAEDAGNATYGAAFHLVGRTQGAMLGGFVGIESVDHIDHYAVGAEGALYFERFTLAGLGAYIDADNVETDGIAGLAEARYFFTRNLRVEASLGYSHFRTLGVDADTLFYGAGAEFRFKETPLSVFAQMRHYDADGATADTDLARLGLRYNFDPDLAARDENGASLTTMFDLLDIS